MTEPIVSINQGFLKGKIGTDINGRTYYGFLGIPYAKPPIGELRFKAPQPPDTWEGVRDATKDGNPCFSREFFVLTIVGSEDCLFLNVYTPELPQERTNLKPVMVYIHGGGYTQGCNSSKVYGPEFLLTEDVVLVVVNYRLGVLGFLQLDDPEAHVPGNAGCKDVVMALKWVQSNIRHFDGDPNNVTVFGADAGGALAHLLMLSPMGKGLFHKVIAQSGCALAPWAIAKSREEELLNVIGCPYTKGKDILRYLQELPVEKVLEAQDKVPNEFSAHTFLVAGPVIEKHTSYEAPFLTQDPLDIILDGNYNKVPLMIGYTKHEGLASQVIDDFETIVPNCLNFQKGSKMSMYIANKIKSFYFGEDIPSKENIEISNLVHSDSLVIYPVCRSVKKHLFYFELPIYLYRFSLDEGLNYMKKSLNLQRAGAAHTDDIGYLFKTPITPANLPENSIELKSVRRMVKLWTNFAKTGDPNPIENVVWKAVLKDEVNMLDIGKELVSCINPDQDRKLFWDEILYGDYLNSEHL